MAGALKPMKWDDDTLLELVTKKARSLSELANALDTNVLDADFQLAIKRLKNAGRIAFDAATRKWGVGPQPRPRVWPGKKIDVPASDVADFDPAAGTATTIPEREDPAADAAETPIQNGEVASGAPIADQTVRMYHRRGPPKTELRQFVEEQLQQHGRVVRSEVMAHFAARGQPVEPHNMTNVLHRLKVTGRITAGRGSGVWDRVDAQGAQDPGVVRTELSAAEVDAAATAPACTQEIWRDTTDVSNASNKWPQEEEARMADKRLEALADSLQTFIHHLVARTASEPLVSPLGLAEAIEKAADYICAIACRK